jgi:YHS domain-containing protein
MKAFARLTLIAACLGWSAAALQAGGAPHPDGGMAGGPAAIALPWAHLPSAGERVLKHDLAGIALMGFDPVGYFESGRPVAGSREHELTHEGTTWRFASRANLEAFRQDPAVFAPAFGGHDAAAVAMGRAVDADPQLFRIIGGRLYLFRSRETREQFAGNDALRGQADQRWQDVKLQLAR